MGQNHIHLYLSKRQTTNSIYLVYKNRTLPILDHALASGYILLWEPRATELEKNSSRRMQHNYGADEKWNMSAYNAAIYFSDRCDISSIKEMKYLFVV